MSPLCPRHQKILPSAKRNSRPRSERSDQAGTERSPLGQWKGQPQAGVGRSPFGTVARVKRKLAQGVIHWDRGKGKRLVGRCLTLSKSREFKERPRKYQDDRLGPTFKPSSLLVNRHGLQQAIRGAHQATAPSTQLVGCDGDWPADQTARFWQSGHWPSHAVKESLRNKRTLWVL
jgi:hypothetical protein